MTDLVCGSCTYCCRGEAIVLQPEDDPSQYETTNLPDGRVILRTKADGSCIYLGNGGCAIHGRHPSVCRTFDCRRIAEIVMAFSRPRRREFYRRNTGMKELVGIGLSKK